MAMVHSKATCIEMIHLYLDAEKTVLTGQSYKIGTRELTRANLNEIISARQMWENNLEKANNNGNRKQSMQVLIRDL